jgi:hypothetical protein
VDRVYQAKPIEYIHLTSKSKHLKLIHKKVPFHSSQQTDVGPKLVDCGSDQGRSTFQTGGVAALRREIEKCENADMGRKSPILS